MIMLKYVIAVVLVCGASLYVSTQYKQHAQDSANHPSQPIAKAPSTGNNEKPESNVSHAEWNPPRWYRLFSWPEGLGVWGLFLTLVVVAEQTSETRKAAQATQAGVQVAKNAERAWITVAPGLLSPKLYPSWAQGTTYPTDPETLKMVRHQLPLLIKNVGKTPAKMDEFACRYIRVGSMEELPAEPDYGLLQTQGGHWIIPGDTHNAPVDLETDNGILYERHVKDIRLRQSFLIAFGIVKYSDIHGERHKTQFCFVYTFPIPGIVDADGNEIPARFFKTGPEKYNYAD